MIEGLRAVTGQVLASEAMALLRTDEDPLELAVREHARLVYRVAFSVPRNHHDAEDATQETFLRVMRYRRKLAGVRDARNWLARIAWRVAVERRRKVPEIALDDVASVVEQVGTSTTSTDDMMLSTERSGFLRILISALPAKLRDPLTLSTVEEMSSRDIAEVLGIKEAVVRSRLFRARQILREKLAALLRGKHGI